MTGIMSRSEELMPFADTHEKANEYAGSAREEAVRRMTTDGRVVSARGVWESGWDEACIRAQSIIRDLETALAQRDHRIAELEASCDYTAKERDVNFQGSMRAECERDHERGWREQLQKRVAELERENAESLRALVAALVRVARVGR